MGVEEVTGITDRLKGKIEAYRQKFDAWAATQNGQLQKVKQQQDIAISTGESQITDLMAQSQALEVEVARAHQDHAVAKHEVDSMRGELGPLKARAAVYPEKMRLAQQTLDEERSLLANSRAMCQDIDANQSATLLRKTSEVDVYAQQLGLHLESEGATLSMTFTKVDPSDVGKQHTLRLHVDQDSKYVVDGCVPALGQLRQETTKLNRDNDFGGFTQNVRGAFRALYA